MTTTRERKQNKADRLREWADKRVTAANATFKHNERYTRDHAFNTQPGHIPFRARIIKQEDNAFRSLNKAAGMTARAAGIEDQMDRAIYSDDPDAIERLQERIAALEAKRDARKAANDAYRKTHRAELKALTPYGRNQAVPFPPYSITNLTADIARNKKRLEALQRPPVTYWRLLEVRYGGECDTCGVAIQRGEMALYEKTDKALRHQDCHQKPEAAEPTEPANSGLCVVCRQPTDSKHFLCPCNQTDPICDTCAETAPACANDIQKGA